MLTKLKEWARRIMRDVHALYLAARDRRTPWYAKMTAFAVAVYALSPIDLIPDFIPVIGYLDDLVLVPLGIMLAVRFVPPALMAEHRETARRAAARPVSRSGATVIVGIWAVAGLMGSIWLWRRFS